MNYISQYLQDEYVDKFFNKDNGVFVDVGAGDGIDINNTYFLEKMRKWSGLCIEPHIQNYEKLVKNRNCFLENCAILETESQKEFLALEGYPLGLSGIMENYDPRHAKRVEHEVSAYNAKWNKYPVTCIPLQKLLNKYNLFNIDYCSIDVEGSEINVLKSIDFSKTNIKLFTIENNFNSNDVKEYLSNYGYILIKKLSGDDVFIKK